MKKKTVEQITHEVDKEWKVLEKNPKLLAMKKNYEENYKRVRQARDFDERLRLYRSIKNDLILLQRSAEKKEQSFYDDLFINIINRLIGSVDQLNPLEVEEVPESFEIYSSSMDFPRMPPELAKIQKEDDYIPF